MLCPSKRSCLTRSVACLLVMSLLSLLLSLYQSELLSLDSDREEKFIVNFGEELDSPGRFFKKNPIFLQPEEDFGLPIVVWWTPFTGDQRIERQCGESVCLFTHSRTELNNSRTKAFMFYGTDLDWKDLPLPRRDDQLWALLHEESPKNNWIFASEGGISLFNLTATCSRYSDYPLSTQFFHKIEWLEKPVKVETSEKSANGLGLVMYLQSDCDPPSDRDSYVEELMKYVSVDSYGKCLHNKDLPQHLQDSLTFNSDEVHDIVSKYKFSLAFENARCHDYITEKYWRPLYVGSVPIVMGSPTIKDWAPNNHSIIVAEDFENPQALAEYLHLLDQNDKEYERYLEFKKTGVTNPLLLRHARERGWVVDYIEEGRNFIDGFECFVCEKIHQRLRLESADQRPPPLIANQSHYNCPIPEPSLKHRGDSMRERMADLREHARRELQYWRYVSHCSDKKGQALRDALSRGGTAEEVNQALQNACSGMSIAV